MRCETIKKSDEKRKYASRFLPSETAMIVQRNSWCTKYRKLLWTLLLASAFGSIVSHWLLLHSNSHWSHNPGYIFPSLFRASSPPRYISILVLPGAETQTLRSSSSTPASVFRHGQRGGIQVLWILKLIQFLGHTLRKRTQNYEYKIRYENE